MPKDKTETHNKLVACMRSEFLEKGFEKASLNEIARKCGITPAGVYRHYASKEAMFESLVQPALEAFYGLCDEYMQGMTREIGEVQGFGSFAPFDEQWVDAMLDVIYEYFDEFRLLLVCSGGTKYEQFKETLINMETETYKDMFRALDKEGIPYGKVTDGELHIAATAYITAMLEIVHHNLPKEEAITQLKFIVRFFNGAWKTLFHM